MKYIATPLLLSLAITLVGCNKDVEIDYQGPVAGWEHWGGDEGGSRV